MFLHYLARRGNTEKASFQCNAVLRRCQISAGSCLIFLNLWWHARTSIVPHLLLIFISVHCVRHDDNYSWWPLMISLMNLLLDCPVVKTMNRVDFLSWLLTTLISFHWELKTLLLYISSFVSRWLTQLSFHSVDRVCNSQGYVHCPEDSIFTRCHHNGT